MAVVESGTPALADILQITSDTINVSWIIKEFDRLYEECGGAAATAADVSGNISSNKEITHCKFMTGIDFGIRTAGKIFFCKETETDSMGVYLQLSCRPPVDGTKIQATYTLSMKMNNGKVISMSSMHSIQEKPDISTYNTGYGCKNFMTINELREKYLTEGVLKVLLTVRLYCGTNEGLKISFNELRNREEIINKDLTQSFGELFVSAKFSDMVFGFSNEQDKDVEISGHKMLLSARSSVFAAMFNAEMKEGLTGKVVIDDVSAKAFKIMLEFIYTGKVNREWGSVADELIYAANKYELPTLQAFLNEYIREVITVDNAIKVRKMAKLCNLPKAQKDLEMYIKYYLVQCLDMLDD